VIDVAPRPDRAGARGLETRLFGSIIFPLYHRVRGDAVLARIAEYERAQWETPAGVRSMQERKLDALLRHAVSQVPYFGELLSSVPAGASPVERLLSLPPLTKAVIRARAADLRARNVPDVELEPNSTSGSSGEPLYFYTDKRSSDCRKAAVVINRHWAGINLGDRESRLWGSPIDQRRADALRGRLHSWLTRTQWLSAYDLSRESMARYREALRRFRPRLLIAYPSVLETFALEARLEGAALTGLHAIIVSAETLYPHQRELFESVFGCPVFNRYGSREVGDMAQECGAHRGLHVNAGRVWLEIVREDLSPCAPGETGDILVTDLDNYGMPMIRYAIGDRATAAAEPCVCGRGLPLLSGIEGRSMDVVRFPNGCAVGGTYWTILLRRHPGLEQFQVVQRAEGRIVIRYVGAETLSERLVRFVTQDVRERGGQGVKLGFERVERIDVNVAGKKRLIVREG
jgi:phenylacetate-CoA ligase